MFGSWRPLHRATLIKRWTGSASPGAALLGSPGQGTYAAANSWVDVFAHWRPRPEAAGQRDLGWGAWGGSAAPRSWPRGAKIMITRRKARTLRDARAPTRQRIPSLGGAMAGPTLVRPWGWLFLHWAAVKGANKFPGAPSLPQDEWAGRLYGVCW